MARRKSYRRGRLKFKLRKGTVYSIFSFGFILLGIILLLSFTKNGNNFILINSLLDRYFGKVALFFPFILIFFGFFFLRLRLFLSRANISIGFLLFFVSLVALLRGGLVGKELFKLISDILTDFGAVVIYLAGVFVGLIVFFNTSVDEIVEFVNLIFRNIYRLFPSSLFNFFKNKNTSGFDDKQMKIKGGKPIPNLSASPTETESLVIKKNSPLLSDKLVSNPLVKSGLWEYPPFSLLSEGSSHKADRGDVKRVANTIEKTLQSFSIGAKVVEVNLGPAVTQYALEIALGTKVSKITSLSNDLALATEAPTGQIRIEAPIP